MTGITSEDRSDETGSSQKDMGGGLRFDWLYSLLSIWLIGGVYLDGWAHNHVQNLETFITPWHGVLYSGFFVLFGTLLLVVLRNRRRGTPWRRSLPAGYALSLLGAGIFLAGGVLDFLWHQAFGIERTTEALLSPTHLTLAFGVVLLVSGPLRAGWLRGPDPNDKRTRARWATRRMWAELFPSLISLTFILSLLTFLTQFAHPQVDPWATAKDASDENTDQVYTVRLDGSALTRLTEDPRSLSIHPSWSPDRSRIAYTNVRDRHPQIYVMNADGSGKRPVTSGSAHYYTPRWSPDGRTLALGSNRDGKGDLYVMSSDGGELTRLTSTQGGDLSPSWSPDGTRIAFTSGRDGMNAVYVMSADGSRQARLTTGEAPNYFPSWSPDGARVAFTSERDGHAEIYVMNTDGTRQTRLTKGAQDSSNPAWSPDGQKIAFLANRDSGVSAWLMNADGTDARDVLMTLGMDASQMVSWSPDGSRIVFSLRGRPSTPLWLTIDLGLASILIQVVILTVIILSAARRWVLPFGALTLILGFNTILMSFQNDKYSFIPVAVLAGLAGDLLYRGLRPSVQHPGSFRLFALALPLIYYALYFVVIAVTDGIGWSIHLWAGAIVMAGLVGLLLSYVVVPMTTNSSVPVEPTG